jgi:ABC-type Fe3+-hydroxamate transport system substrate-binding protein
MWYDPNKIPDKNRRDKKIISLVPSLTELLFDLGLASQIKGRTKFCIHPMPEVKRIEVIGGTKNIRVEKIKNIHPDIIIANKEENTKEDIEAVSAFAPVYVTDISSIDDIIVCIKDWSEYIPETEGEKLAEQLTTLNFENIFPAKSAAYLIWKNPLMTVGGDTFIHHMLTRAGLVNVFGDTTRYPVTNWDELRQKKPDLVFLSSEPYPFTRQHISTFSEFLPDSKIVLVDGEIFSWYGSRVLKAPAYFRDLAENLFS